MADSPILPGAHSWTGDRAWYGFFRSLLAFVNSTTQNTTDLTSLTQQITALQAQVDETGGFDLSGSTGRVAVYGDATSASVDIDPAYDRMTACRISLGF
jgi:hypothetical protein